MQPAGFRSIRWQLPLTYALIALVSAVALGVLLIGVLRQYYWQQEYNILDSMSMLLARQLSFRLDNPLDASTLDTLPSFSFPPDYRIEFFSPEGDTVFDTGVLNTMTIEFSDVAVSQAEPIILPQYESGLTDFALRMNAPTVPYFVTPVAPLVEADVLSLTTLPTVPPVTPVPDATLPLLNDSSQSAASSGIASPFSPTLVPEVTFAERWPLDAQEAVFSNVSVAVPSSAVVWRVLPDGQGATAFFASHGVQEMERNAPIYRDRSSASVMRMIASPAGQVMGYFRLSNPPAIGIALIESVTSGAIVAGTGAILIAAIVGWWVSLRLIRPLLVLNDATARMSQGDLAARVDVRRRDELGALADSFNAMADKVETTVAALRRFAADAAHELHTPMTAIKTNLELTRERPDAARLTEAIAQIERLEALADDLLDLLRLEVAEAPRQEPVDVGALVREVSEVYASRAEQAGVEFALNVGDALPKVSANVGLLRRALSNLLDNAVKFTPSGGDVSLTARCEGERLAFVVEDSGIGVPSGDLPVLFSRFHRGSNTADYPGSGLGLAIVKAIADVHHGSVRAENTPTGARFVLHLPVAQVT